MTAQRDADLEALREREGGEREVVAEWTRKDRLTAALERVETEHRRGDHTEDGFVGNSIDGLECRCWERWPCAAAQLRIEVIKAKETLGLLEAALTPTGDHHTLPDGYCLDCGGGCLIPVARENTEQLRQAAFAGPSPFVTKGGE